MNIILPLKTHLSCVTNHNSSNAHLYSTLSYLEINPPKTTFINHWNKYSWETKSINNLEENLPYQQKILQASFQGLEVLKGFEKVAKDLGCCKLNIYVCLLRQGRVDCWHFSADMSFFRWKRLKNEKALILMIELLLLLIATFGLLWSWREISW